MLRPRVYIPLLLAAGVAAAALTLSLRPRDRYPPGSEAAWAAAVRKNPADPVAHTALAQRIVQRSAGYRREAAQAEDKMFAARSTGRTAEAEQLEKQIKELQLSASQAMDSAILHYRAALSHKPSHAAAALDLAQVYLDQLRPEPARDVLRDVLKHLPKGSVDEAYANKKLADAYLMLENSGLARSALQQALAVKPDYVAALITLAMAHIAEDEPDEARARLARAQELEPQNPEIYNARGLLAIKLQQPAEALAPFAKAVELAPRSAGYRCNYGDALKRAGKYNDALAQFTAAVRCDRHFPLAYVYLGETHHLRGDDRRAIDYLKIAIALVPENARYRGRLAEILGTTRDWKQRDMVLAVVQAEEAVRLSKDNDLQLLRLLAQLYRDAARYNEAIDTARKAEKLALRLGWQQSVEEIRLAITEYRELQAKNPPKE